MKSTATQMNDNSRKSAEWTGFRIATTRIEDATAIVPTAKKRRKGMLEVRSIFCLLPSAPTSSSAPDHLLTTLDLFWSAFFRQSGVDRPVVPVLELLHVEVEIVAVVGGQLVGLRGQPDRLRLGGAGLFAERAEHAALDVDVVAVEDFELLHLAVHLALLVVDVDVDDVDGTGHRAQLAGDAAVVVEAEHAAEAVGRLHPLLGLADRHLRREERTKRGRQPLEHVDEV